MENYIFAGRARAGAIERRVDGDAERLCAAWDARHAVHRQVLEADHRADDKTMIPAPAIISARAAAFVCSSSVTPRAAAIHLGMNQIQSATKNVAKIAALARTLAVKVVFTHVRATWPGAPITVRLLWPLRAS